MILLKARVGAPRIDGVIAITRMLSVLHFGHTHGSTPVVFSSTSLAVSLGAFSGVAAPNTSRIFDKSTFLLLVDRKP